VTNSDFSLKNLNLLREENIMKILKTFGISIILISLAGCAVLNLVVGTSTCALEHEKIRSSKVFDKDIGYCYQASFNALKKWNVNLFQTKKNSYIIATNLYNIFDSCIDTTEVGIFFKKLEPDKTQIGVASLNHQLGQFIADNLFKYIENPETPLPPVVRNKPFKSN